MNLSYTINNALSGDIAIDVGSEMIRIFAVGMGLLVKERAYVAYNKQTFEIIAYGDEAFFMLGKEAKNTIVNAPFENGVIKNFELAQKMISFFVRNVCKKSFIKPRVMVSIPSGCTEIEKKAICECIKNSGARTVYLFEDTLAAAYGAGCDISLARGMMVVNIGGGRTGISSVSGGKSVSVKACDICSQKFSNAIIEYIKKNYNMVIGYQTAERIKNELGCAYPFETAKTAEIAGCNAATGLPFSVMINSEEIRDSFSPILEKLSEFVASALEDTPSELQSDIVEDGILLTGGGALLFGIDKWLRNQLNIKVFVAEKAQDCVINGLAGQLLEMARGGIQSQERKYYTVGI